MNGANGQGGNFESGNDNGKTSDHRVRPLQRAAELAKGLVHGDQLGVQNAHYARGVKLAQNILSGKFPEGAAQEFGFPYFIEGTHDDTHRGMLDAFGSGPVPSSRDGVKRTTGQVEHVADTDRFSIDRTMGTLGEEGKPLIEWRYRVSPRTTGSGKG